MENEDVLKVAFTPKGEILGLGMDIQLILALNHLKEEGLETIDEALSDITEGARYRVKRIDSRKNELSKEDIEAYEEIVPFLPKIFKK